jgi:hypothetical protein
LRNSPPPAKRTAKGTRVRAAILRMTDSTKNLTGGHCTDCA